MLSFAVGSLLGDVFLHLLPETWDNAGGTQYFLAYKNVYEYENNGLF